MLAIKAVDHAKTFRTEILSWSSTEPVHCPGWWYSLPQSSQRLLHLVPCKGSSALGAFWVASTPCRSRWPRGQTRLCVLMPTLWSQISPWREKGTAAFSSSANDSGHTDHSGEERWTCIFLQWWWWCHDMVNKVFNLFSFSPLGSRS